MAPAMPSARAVICTRRGWVCIAGSLSVGRFLGCVVRLGRCSPPWPFLPEAPSRLTTRTHYTVRSEEHTSELQSLMRISYAVFCLKKKKNPLSNTHYPLNITNNTLYTINTY